jgi:hypothetical protein
MKVRLIPDNYTEGIVLQLRLHRQELLQQGSPYAAPRLYHYPETLESSPTMDLPELHLFRDSRGDLWGVVAWSQDDALRLLQAEHGPKPPLQHEGGVACWPGLTPPLRLSSQE